MVRRRQKKIGKLEFDMPIRMIFENTKILLTNRYIFEFLKFQKFDVTVFSSNIANDRHTNNKF